MTGDPWAPVNIKDNKLLSLDHEGFSYRRLTTLLFDENWRKPPLAIRHPTDPPDTLMTLVARCLVRGQGKTEGYHERVVPMTPKVIQAFGRPAEEATLGALSRERIDDAGTARKVLSESVAALAAGGALTEKGSVNTGSHSKTGYLWADRLDTHVDARFFADLWAAFEAPADQRPALRTAWRGDLVARASALLNEAAGALPLPVAHRHRALARARRHFVRRARKAFPDLFPVTPPPTEASPDDRTGPGSP